MDFDFQYKKALQEYNLREDQLPEDAKTGIENINGLLNIIRMNEAKGKKISDSTIRKIKAQDKWVYYEILDIVEGTDDNNPDAPVGKEDVEDEAAKAAAAAAGATEGGSNEPAPKPAFTESDKQKELGIAIEEELKALYGSGRKDWDTESIKSSAPKTYKLLFDTYEEGKENGVTTSGYSLLETENKLFNLKRL